MAITSVFAPQVIRWMGTRMATLTGLCATTILTLAFGIGPDVTSMPTLQWLYFFTYFGSGLLGALAETSCIIMVSARFRENPGAIMASINTVCVVGCSLGPTLGSFALFLLCTCTALGARLW